MFNGSVAQLVEHDTLNVGVVGSRPTGTTQKISIVGFLFGFHCGKHVAVNIIQSRQIIV